MYCYFYDRTELFLDIHIFDYFHNNCMVFVLLQSADNNDRDDPLNTFNSYGDPAAMYGIFASRITQPVFCSKCNLIALELALHIPGTTAPSEHRLALPRNPAVVVGHHTRVCACVEEGLVLVRERDVNHDGRRDGQQSTAQRRAHFPGILDREVLEDEGAVDAFYGRGLDEQSAHHSAEKRHSQIFSLFL